MAKFCTQCGFQNAEEIIFCGQCGQKLGVGGQAKSPLERQDSSLAVISVVVSIFIPIIFPLVMWLTQRGQNKQVEDAAKEVLNFQLSYVVSLIIIMIMLGILSFFGALITYGLGAFFGVMLMGFVNFALGVTYLVFMITAAVKVSKNQPYRFPLTIRLIK